MWWNTVIAIISEVHGNYPALKAVLAEIDNIGCNRIISLGDVSGYYCMVNECIEEFRKRKIVNILGNHDYYVLGRGDCPRSYTVNRITEYQRQIITPDNKEYLACSKDFIDTSFLSARHGGWNDPVDEYVDEFDFDIAEKYPIKMFCSGHTHIQKLCQKDDITYFNPGSVGQPRDYDNRAGFAIIHDDGNVKLYRVKYDIDEICFKMKQAGFEERIYECLYKGTRIGATK